ncbi:hypothetical protein G6F51_014428 [Rhizopus arrhizus]|uniref:Uncharacterized protein n=1 Tax=Rhizopus oryzae TaxID=64495 RepID=A0A9P7BYM1_RHIOR|nr:hypothetical protein G6F51_014428 [Rhizopus arrhizus]
MPPPCCACASGDPPGGGRPGDARHAGRGIHPPPAHPALARQGGGDRHLRQYRCVTDPSLPEERRQRLPAQALLARGILLPGLAERGPAGTDRHPAGPGHPRLPHRAAQPPLLP